MIIDCHAHLDPRALSVPNLIAKMDEHGIDRAALIPRITENVEPEKSSLLLSIQRTLMNSNLCRPIAAAVSQTFYDANGHLRSIWKPFTDKSRGYQKTMRPDNASVPAALAKHPDRFWGWLFLNPKDNPSVLNELEQGRSVPGIIGIKVHPYWHQYPLSALAPIAKRAQELNLPFLIHLGFGEQGRYKWMLETFPKLKIVFAHAGIPYFKALWSAVRDRNGAYVDLSSPHLSESFVRGVVAALGPGKCMYGTDSPYGFGASEGSYDYGHVKGWIERLRVPDSDRELIFSGNFLNMAHV